RIALLACADASTRKTASRWLASAGFDVVPAATSAEALEQLGRHRPAVVLTEMSLRDERGRTLCEAVSRRVPRPQVPVLALCSGQREVKAALEAGASDLLQRPFDWHVGCVRVESLVRLGETADQLALARQDADRLRKAIEDERQDRGTRDHFDAL